MDDKVGGRDGRYARYSSSQPGRRLRGGKVSWRIETGHIETRYKETGGTETGDKMKSRCT